jgi:hypothetical protein
MIYRCYSNIHTCKSWNGVVEFQGVGTDYAGDLFGKPAEGYIEELDMNQ